MQARGVAQRPRGHLPTNSRVLVTESTLKRKDQVAPAFYVIHELCQYGLAIGLLTVMDRVPVPILNHVRAGSGMGVNIQAQLAIVWWKLLFGIPADGLCVGFRDQVVGLLERADVIADVGRRFAVELVLSSVIWVRRCDVEDLDYVGLVHFRAGRTGKVMHHKLIGTLVLIDDGRLPSKKIGSHPLGVALPFKLPSWVDDTVARGQLGPIVKPLSPVVQPPNLIEGICRLEL